MDFCDEIMGNPGGAEFGCPEGESWCCIDLSGLDTDTTEDTETASEGNCTLTYSISGFDVDLAGVCQADTDPCEGGTGVVIDLDPQADCPTTGDVCCVAETECEAQTLPYGASLACEATDCATGGFALGCSSSTPNCCLSF